MLSTCLISIRQFQGDGLAGVVRLAAVVQPAEASDTTEASDTAVVVQNQWPQLVYRTLLLGRCVLRLTSADGWPLIVAGYWDPLLVLSYRHPRSCEMATLEPACDPLLPPGPEDSSIQRWTMGRH